MEYKILLTHLTKTEIGFTLIKYDFGF